MTGTIRSRRDDGSATADGRTIIVVFSCARTGESTNTNIFFSNFFYKFPSHYLGVRSETGDGGDRIILHAVRPRIVWVSLPKIIGTKKKKTPDKIIPDRKITRAETAAVTLGYRDNCVWTVIISYTASTARVTRKNKKKNTSPRLFVYRRQY